MKIKKLTFLAIYTAIMVIIARMILIPIPNTNGFVTLLDAGVFLAALRFSKSSDVFLVSGLSAFILDLIAGYPQWMIFSLIIHGTQGYVASKKPHKYTFILASLIMVVGYYFASVILYGWAGAFAGVFTNILQNIVGILAALLLNKALDKVDLKWI